MVTDAYVTRIRKRGQIVIVVFFLLFPFIASAQVAQFSFTTSPQTVAPNTVSEVITVQAQDSTGSSVSLTQTACLNFSSTSSSGQFSSNATSWTPVSSLTMNKGTANKNFYHKDSLEGMHKISVQVALRPEGETRSCASWPIQEWNIQWTITQDIVIASAQSGSIENGSETQNQATTNTSSTNTSAQTSSHVAPPESQIYADAGTNRTVIVAADTEFFGRAYNHKKEPIASNIRFLWNFGDGSTAEGQSVMHNFVYPGKYAVVLSIAENRDAASDRIIVTAEPAKLAFSSLPDGGVIVENNSGRDLDLSGWIIRSLGRYFVMPQDSLILASEPLRIGEKTLGFRSSHETELAYPNGVLMLRSETKSEEMGTEKPGTPAAASLPSSEKVSAVTSSVSLDLVTDERGGPVSETENTVSGAPNIQASSSQIAAGATVSSSGASYLWWFAAVGMVVVSIGAVLASRRAGKREWDIVEESAE